MNETLVWSHLLSCWQVFPTFNIVGCVFCQCGSPGTMTRPCKRRSMQDYSWLEFSCATGKTGVFNYSCWLSWKTNLIQALNLPISKPSVVETLCEENTVFSGPCSLPGPWASDLGDSALQEFQTEIFLRLKHHEAFNNRSCEMQKSQCHQAEIPALILSVQTEQKKKRWKETMDWEGWWGGGH